VNYAKKEDLDKATSDGGFEQWFQLFGSKGDFQRNPDLPTTHPWKINNADWTTQATGDRNPFYFKVDPEGNQLPYLDQISWIIVADAEMIPMRLVTGEVEHQAWSTGIKNYTLYMENREKGGYDVSIWDYGGSGTSMHVNQAKKIDAANADQKEIYDLLKTRDFRLALSKAMDRDDINTLVYQGLSDPAIELYPESVKADPDVQAIFEYNEDDANALLDGLGMTERDSEGYRLTAAGKPLDITMIGLPMYAIHQDVAQVIVEYWKTVGVKCTMDWIAIELWWDRVAAGDYDIVGYESDYSSGNLFRLTYPRAVFPVDSSTYWAGPWGAWYSSGGKSGVEPDDPDGKKLQDLYDAAIIEPDAAKRQAILDESFGIVAKNMWPIHTVANRPEPNIVKKGFRNVPEWGTDWWPVYGERTSKPEQYWIEQA
jgi:peptide/nickel transport system substrate-binding protein